MKYIIYARKSQEDKNRQVQSISSQLAWAYDVAEREGLEVLQTFSDTQTGKDPGRPGFASMIEFINGCVEDVAILTWKIDRLARNPVDEGAIKYALIQGRILGIKTSGRSYTQADNQILLGVDFGEATQYSITISENATRGMNDKRKMGWMPSKAPIGYINEKSDRKGSNRIFADHEGNRFRLIKRAWELLLTGSYSVVAIRTKLNGEWGFRRSNGQPMSNTGMYYVFHNVFYSGHFSHGEELLKGKHEPMITLEDFDKAQIILGDNGKPRRQTHDHKYTGIVRCAECNCMITAEPPKRKVNKRGEVRIFNYMRCSKKNKDIKCSQPYIRLEDFENEVDEFLEKISIPKAFHEWSIKQLRVWAKEESKQSTYRRSHIQKKYNENESKMDKLVDALVNGVVDESTYKESRTRYELEQKRLKDQLGDYEQNKVKWLDEAEKVFDLAREARSKFDKGDRETKRRVLKAFGSNFSLKDKKLLVELQMPFRQIEKAVDQTKTKFGSLEPFEKGLDKVKTGRLEEATSEWLRGRDSNPRHFG